MAFGIWVFLVFGICWTITLKCTLKISQKLHKLFSNFIFKIFPKCDKKQEQSFQLQFDLRFIGTCWVEVMPYLHTIFFKLTL